MRVEFWNSTPWEPLGPYFESLLRRLGYRASVHTVPDLHLIGEAAAGPPEGQPQMGLWGWGAISAAPFTFVPPIVACDGAVNHSKFCSPQLDALMSRAAEARGLQITRLWRRVEAEIAAHAPTVPLYNQSSLHLAAKRVGNWQFHPIWGPLLEQLWVQ
jgi:ABC-type transport system substrate-binding protein